MVCFGARKYSNFSVSAYVYKSRSIEIMGSLIFTWLLQRNLYLKRKTHRENPFSMISKYINKPNSDDIIKGNQDKNDSWNKNKDKLYRQLFITLFSPHFTSLQRKLMSKQRSFEFISTSIISRFCFSGIEM